MCEFVSTRLAEIRRLNEAARHSAEHSEADIVKINEMIGQIASLWDIADIVILGEVAIQQPYVAQSGQSDSALVYQAAVVLPSGLGALLWDMEEYLSCRHLPDREREAHRLFSAFAACDPGPRKALLPHMHTLCAELLPLLERRCQSGEQPSG